MSDKRTQIVASPLRELMTAIGLLAVVSPWFLSTLAPNPSPALKALLVALGLLLVFGGMLALFYGFSYVKPSKGKARPIPADDSWKLPPEAADKATFDLSRNTLGSSTGIRNPWQSDYSPLRWTILPERLWTFSELEWRPLPITQGFSTLAVIMIVGPWILGYLTEVGSAPWASLFRAAQGVLLAAGLALLWFAHQAFRLRR